MTLNETLGFRLLTDDPNRVEATIPITEGIRQPFGYVHGGATIALLESVASQGTHLHADLDRELPFGLDVHVQHRKSGVSGMLRGVATLDHVETSSKGYRKLFWNVAAYDDSGDVVSDGTILCIIVPKEKATKK